MINANPFKFFFTYVRDFKGIEWGSGTYYKPQAMQYSTKLELAMMEALLECAAFQITHKQVEIEHIN